MNWTYQRKEVIKIPTDAVGFVYLITCTLTNKKYIGKKIFHFSKTSYKVVKLKNGTKKRKAIRTKIESDWLDYYGSSKEVTLDVTLHGPQHFVREILHLCKTKSEMSYLELKEQVLRDVLHRKDYYNAWISAKVRKFV